jgi:capsular polysaccharide biosynthesis protein
MTINELSDKYLFENYLESDENDRKINVYNISNSRLVEDLFYPNCLIYSNNEVINPINEKIMSLKDLNSKREFELNKVDIINKFKEPVFFFIYNTDNYYHFVYDTLPYLITYNHLKSKINNLKLLLNYPNYESTKLYPFVKEFLEILDIKNDDIIIAKDDVLYESVYISSSFTHGIDSELPPRKEVYDFYKKIVDSVNSKFDDSKKYPSKIYISRRSWIHNDMSNIGTNYTSKRKLVNEDELVDLLISNGYEEIFTENLSTIEKIQMFSKAETVIGAIGGGLCNVLFSNENTQLIALISPTFLDINNRFLYSFSKVKTNLFTDTSHSDIGYWKKYMRIKTNTGIIGEIEDVIDDKLLIIYTDKKVAGWNSQLNLNKLLIDTTSCEKLDNGLNSPWFINIKKLKI